MLAIAASTGIALGALILAVNVTFCTGAVFWVLMGGVFFAMLLIGIDYWQWVHQKG
jgi:hypothetical protein